MDEENQCPVCNGYGEYVLYFNVRTYSNNSYFNTELHHCEFCNGTGKRQKSEDVKALAEHYQKKVLSDHQAAYLRCFREEEAGFHQWYKGWVYPAITEGIRDYSTFREWIKTRRM